MSDEATGATKFWERQADHERGLREIAEQGKRTADFHFEQELLLREAAEAERKELKEMVIDLAHRAEAAEAERDSWRNTARAMRSAADLAANSLHMDGSNYHRGIERIREIWREAQRGYAIEDPLTAYATRLLAALTQQRQALEHYAKKGMHSHELAAVIVATDHAALVAEGETLGVTP